MQKEQQQQQQQPDSTYQDFYASDASSAAFAVADQSSISSYPSEALISVPFQETVSYQDASGLAYHDASTGIVYDETMSVCYYPDPSATTSSFHGQWFDSVCRILCECDKNNTVIQRLCGLRCLI